MVWFPIIKKGVDLLYRESPPFLDLIKATVGLIYHPQTIVLIVMVLEAIIVLARQRSHIHITRALRPVFIIDNVLMDGVRR